MPATSVKVLVALSGGVDSSVCVRLLQEKGYDVTAAVLEMTPHHKDAVKAAQNAADALNIKLYVKQMYDEFSRNVIDYFTKAYKNGITPNPCVVCNPLVKFKAIADIADELGIKYIATGHYARIVNDNGVYKIQAGFSAARDQSYMLYRLNQDILSRLLLPLADMEKADVRRTAKELGLSCADAPDSQENCFIPDGDYAGFIERRCGKSPEGDFISPEGEVCGRHRGIIHYTVGQRKRLGIALGRPVFIKRIDPECNRIYLADAGGEFAPGVILSDVTTPDSTPVAVPFDCHVKIRSAAKLTPASVFPEGDGCVRVVFKTPQRAPAKGQSVVFYDALNRVVGGGFIKDEIVKPQ